VSIPNTYDVGTLVQTMAQFVTAAGAPQDPPNVYFDYLPPGGSTVHWTYGGTGSIVRSSTGVYTASVDTTGIPGIWAYRWYSTEMPNSGGLAAADYVFYVTASRAN